MDTHDISISRPVAAFLVRVEKYIFPLVYALMSWREMRFLQAQYSAYVALKSAQPISLPTQDLFTGGFLKHVLLLILMLSTAGALLFNRSPTALPDKLKHVLIPFAMCFYFVLYGLADAVPAGLRQNALPVAWQLPFALTGLALSIAGYCLSIWAITCLGRAFALMVSVRKVVLGGPYAYVRHPIYSGYLLDSLGLLLVSGSVVMLILVAGFILLMICRARLEEEKLSESSPLYREHRRQTGFFFPPLRQALPSPPTR